MEDYTKNPIEQEQQHDTSFFTDSKKTLWALVTLIFIGGVFTYGGSLVINKSVKNDNGNTFVASGIWESLDEAGINTDLSGVDGIPNASPGTETRDFRKVADVSFYEQRSTKALEQGLIQDWASAQLEVSAAYIAQGGEYTLEASDPLKSIIANREVPKEGRAIAMAELAGLYCRSGQDARVASAVYTGPYAEFYVEGDSALASLRMMETSYNMFPRARTAVSIANMYITPIIVADLSTQEKQDARDNALTFLRNAEVLARDSYNPREISGEYASYLFWRAVSYGKLGMEYTEYVNDAEDAYVDLFAYLDGYTGTFNTTVTDIIPFAHMRYATFLKRVYGDTKTNKIEENLTILVTLVENDPNPEINIFIKYLNNKRVSSETNEGSLRWINYVRGYSTKYDALLEQYGLPDQSKV